MTSDTWNYIRKVRARVVEWRLVGQMSNITNEGTSEDRREGHRVSQILMFGCDHFTVEVSLLWRHNTWGSTTDHCPKLKVMVLASIWASTAVISMWQFKTTDVDPYTSRSPKSVCHQGHIFQWSGRAFLISSQFLVVFSPGIPNFEDGWF